MPLVKVKVVRKVGLAPASITVFDVPSGSITGAQLRRALHVKKHELLLSVDVGGHVQEEADPIGDDEVIFVRANREFFASTRATV